jgi:hypothetical protein
MGAGQSIPSTLTREKVFELTKDTRGVMNILLDYMLKELTVRDFLALSNPTECKKYVLFMANNLYKYFYELEIVPTKDKRGVIAFRLVKELVNPPEDDQMERQSLCLTLSYFYTRIFQIYGALALTLIDDAQYMIESGIIPHYGDTTKKGLLPPGYRAYTTQGGTRQDGGLPNGRTLVLDLGNFYFLKSYLSSERSSSKGFLTRYNGEGESDGIIYFDTEKRRRDVVSRRGFFDNEETQLQRGVFSIGYSGAKNYSYLEVFAKSEGIGTGRIKIEFGKISYIKKGTTESLSVDVPSDLISQKSFSVKSFKASDSAATEYTISGSTLTVTEYFNKVFQKVVPYVKQHVEGTKESSTASETGTEEQLRLGRTIQNLVKTKPLGHCLARALQLLKNVPMKGEPGISNICRAKFFEQTITSSETGTKKIVSRSGIPEPGSSLDTSPGLAALSQLFYDTVLIGSPKLVMGTKPGPGGGPSTTQQYISFMKTMARLFGDDLDSIGAPKSNAVLKEAGLKGIRDRRDKDLCGSVTGEIIVPASVTGNVYDIVNQMYKMQVEHAAKAGQIFSMLFNIKRDKPSGRFIISLSENIIKKGFPEIERINFLARDVLVKYYSTCELKYLQGMKIIIDAKKKSESAGTSIITSRE